MTPIWPIEADAFGRSFDPVKAEIRRQGLVWEIIQPRPFLNGVIPVVAGHRLVNQDCVIFSGTYPLMRHIQLHHPWVPGGWCTADNFDCSRYYLHYHRHLLNHSHAVLAIEQALSQVEDVFARFGKDDQIFIRPCGVQKTFTGRCVNREAFVLALESARYAKDAVLVAAPQQISHEWRVIVARGQFVAASQYRAEGDIRIAPGCPPDVCAYVNALLAEVRYQPDPIFMMDVCVCDSHPYLVELNSFSCSGLYECDPVAVVKTVKTLAIESWQESQGSSPRQDSRNGSA